MLSAKYCPFRSGVDVSLIPAWISNFIHYKVWGEIIYQFPSFIEKKNIWEFHPTLYWTCDRFAWGLNRFRQYMMTSSCGKIFRVTGLLRGCHRSHVVSAHKGQWRGALMIFLSAPEQTVEQTGDTSVIWCATALMMTSLQWSHISRNIVLGVKVRRSTHLHRPEFDIFSPLQIRLTSQTANQPIDCRSLIALLEMTSCWRFGERNPPVTDGFPREGPVIPAHVVEQTVELPLIWGTETLFWHYNM